MKKLTTILVIALLSLTISPIALQAQTRKHSKSAKISLDEARAIALKAVPGKIKSEELEKEHGLLIYSFDLETSDGIQEVQIDAKTGKVIKTEKETPEDEAKEKAKETKGNKKH